jgi:hypothetical protein
MRQRLARPPPTPAQRRAARTAAQARCRARKRHRARGEIEVCIWLPRWLRCALVDMEAVQKQERDDPEQLGAGVREMLIEFIRNHGDKL